MMPPVDRPFFTLARLDLTLAMMLRIRPTGAATIGKYQTDNAQRAARILLSGGLTHGTWGWWRRLMLTRVGCGGWLCRTHGGLLIRRHGAHNCFWSGIVVVDHAAGRAKSAFGPGIGAACFDKSSVIWVCR